MRIGQKIRLKAGEVLLNDHFLPGVTYTLTRVEKDFGYISMRFEQENGQGIWTPGWVIDRYLDKFEVLPPDTPFATMEEAVEEAKKIPYGTFPKDQRREK